MREQEMQEEAWFRFSYGHLLGMRACSPIAVLEQLGRRISWQGWIMQKPQRALSIVGPQGVRLGNGAWRIVRNGGWFQQVQNLSG